MKVSDKIVGLRKSKGWSQETLAEQLEVSRQAVSRWELGTVMPDAANILGISKLFGVTTDYLLNEDYESDEDLPKVKERTKDAGQLVLTYLVIIELMLLLIQVMVTFVLQNAFFVLLSILLFAAPVGGFEYAYRKKAEGNTRATACFRKRLYKISAWLGLYVPIRFLATSLVARVSRPVLPLVFECVVLGVYLSVAACVNLSIDRQYMREKALGGEKP